MISKNKILFFINKKYREKRLTQIYDDQELASLKLELNSLELDVISLEEEKNDIEKVITLFNIRHNKELGAIILKILEIKNEKYSIANNDDPIIKSKYEEGKKDYDAYKNAYELEIKKTVIELSKNESILIKKLYKSAIKLCHPDIVADKYAEKANAFFQGLNEAYKNNDLNSVKRILNILEKDDLLIPKSKTITDSKLLRLQIAELNNKITKLINELYKLIDGKEYIFISSLEDWGKYFQKTRNKLELELIQPGNILNKIKTKAKVILLFDYDIMQFSIKQLFLNQFPSIQFKFYLITDEDELLEIIKSNKGNIDLIHFSKSCWYFDINQDHRKQIIQYIEDDPNLNVIFTSTWADSDDLEDLKNKHIIQDYIKNNSSLTSEYIRIVKKLLKL